MDLFTEIHMKPLCMDDKIELEDTSNVITGADGGLGGTFAMLLSVIQEIQHCTSHRTILVAKKAGVHEWRNFEAIILHMQRCICVIVHDWSECFQMNKVDLTEDRFS